jgi:hypothetical protein
MRPFVLACALLFGCSSNDDAASPVADSEVVDTAVDTSSTDTSVATDTGSAADSVADSIADASDSAGDTIEASVDASAETTDAMTCDYVDLDDVVVKCGGKYGLLGKFDVDPPSAACPPYWGFGGKSPHYESKEAAIAGEGCDATCVYTFATAVTRLYCGHKDGYETLKATGCPDLYRFAEGYYESVAAHDAANPCM